MHVVAVDCSRTEVVTGGRREGKKPPSPRPVIVCNDLPPDLTAVCFRRRSQRRRAASGQLPGEQGRQEAGAGVRRRRRRPVRVPVVVRETMAREERAVGDRRVRPGPARGRRRTAGPGRPAGSRRRRVPAGGRASVRRRLLPLGVRPHGRVHRPPGRRHPDPLPAARALRRVVVGRVWPRRRRPVRPGLRPRGVGSDVRNPAGRRIPVGNRRTDSISFVAQQVVLIGFSRPQRVFKTDVGFFSFYRIRRRAGWRQKRNSVRTNRHETRFGRQSNVPFHDHDQGREL